MTIEIKVKNGKWLRADVVENDKVIRNLYHRALFAGAPILTEFQDAAQYVKLHYPQYQKLKVVSLIGQGDIPFGY